MRLDLWILVESTVGRVQNFAAEAAMKDLYQWLTSKAEQRFGNWPYESEKILLASIHLKHGQYLFSKKQPTDCRRQNSQARAILSELVNGVDIEEPYPWIRINLVAQELDLETYDEHESLHQMLAVVEIARENSDYTTESLYVEKVMDLGSQHVSSQMMRRHLHRLQHVYGHHMSDANGIFHSKRREWWFLGDQSGADILEWLKAFEREYPVSPELRGNETPRHPADDRYMDLPVLLMSISWLKSHIMQILGQSDQALQVQSEASIVGSNLAAQNLNSHDPDSTWNEWWADFAKGPRSESATSIDILLDRLRDSRRRNAVSDTILARILQKDAISAFELDLENITREEVEELWLGENVKPEEFLGYIEGVRSWLERDEEFSQQQSSQLLIFELMLQFWGPQRKSHLRQVRETILVKDSMLKYLDSCHKTIQNTFVRVRHRLQLVIDIPFRSVAENANMDLQRLVEARETCTQIVELYQTQQNTSDIDILGSAHLRIAELDTIIASQRGHSVVLSSHFYTADDYFDRFRSELSALSGTDALQVKGRWRDLQFDNEIMLDYAISGCHKQMNDSQIDAEKRNLAAIELWNWVQKSKARAINDMLGLGAQLPRQLIEKIAQDHEKHEIYKLWLLARANFQKMRIDINQVNQARENLEQLELVMREMPILNDVISLTRGKAVTVKDMNIVIETFPAERRSKVVLVDWYERANTGEDPFQLLLVLYRYQKPPQVFELDPLLLQKVKAWIRCFPENLLQEDNDWSSAWEEAQGLSALVAPLGVATSEDDILVLCPTGVLHRFPLHALLVPEMKNSKGNEPQRAALTILERNTVVFTQSMSVLRSCVYARSNNFNSTPAKSAVNRAAIVTPLIDGDSSVDELSDFLHTENYQGRIVHREKLISLCENADLFHFYGHVHKSNEKDPLNSHLLLYTGNEDNPVEDAICSNDETGQHDAKAMLSASDILSSIKFREGAHVNLIACDSGVSHAAAARGDEMLGLIPALIMAGARSACATLWAVDQSSANEWTHRLILEWDRERKRSSLVENQGEQSQPQQGEENYSPNLIDLALCARRASLAIMYEDDDDDDSDDSINEDSQGRNQSKDPRADRMRNWAPYIYHGFWQIPDLISL